MRFAMASCAMLFAAGSAPAADQKFAIAQFDNGAGVKLVVILGYKAADCRKLIETYHSNLKLDCPTCRIDYQSCTTDISNYQAVWLNRKYYAPYVSSGTHRYIISGMSRADAELVCQQTAERLQTQGRSAECIR